MRKLYIALILACCTVVVAASMRGLETPVHAGSVACGAAANQPSLFLPTRVDLCEQNVDAQPSETSTSVQVNGATPGYIVLLECGNVNNVNDQNNAARWSDVVQISASQGITRAQLLSTDGDAGVATLPSPAMVQQANHVFVRETTTNLGGENMDDTVVPYGLYTFHIHSVASLAPCDPPAQVPEGDTLMLVGTGLAGLAGYATLRWRARRASSVAHTAAPKG